MKSTSIILTCAVLLSVTGLTMWLAGCEKEAPAGPKTIALCTGCGQIKGAPACCKADAEKCSKCDLAKGSPGCCNITKGAESAALCAKCGQIKGTELCCKADAEKCPKCNLAKGSPGCCKIAK